MTEDHACNDAGGNPDRQIALEYAHWDFGGGFTDCFALLRH
jgi:hypothetical protein